MDTFFQDHDLLRFLPASDDLRIILVLAAALPVLPLLSRRSFLWVPALLVLVAAAAVSYWHIDGPEPPLLILAAAAFVVSLNSVATQRRLDAAQAAMEVRVRNLELAEARLQALVARSPLRGSPTGEIKNLVNRRSRDAQTQASPAADLPADATDAKETARSKSAWPSRPRIALALRAK